MKKTIWNKYALIQTLDIFRTQLKSTNNEVERENQRQKLIKHLINPSTILEDLITVIYIPCDGSSGHSFFCADNEIDALNIIKNHKYDVRLMVRGEEIPMIKVTTVEYIVLDENEECVSVIDVL